MRGLCLDPALLRCCVASVIQQGITLTVGAHACAELILAQVRQVVPLEVFLSVDRVLRIHSRATSMPSGMPSAYRGRPFSPSTSSTAIA